MTSLTSLGRSRARSGPAAALESLSSSSPATRLVPPYVHFPSPTRAASMSTSLDNANPMKSLVQASAVSPPINGLLRPRVRRPSSSAMSVLSILSLARRHPRLPRLSLVYAGEPRNASLDQLSYLQSVLTIRLRFPRDLGPTAQLSTRLPVAQPPRPLTPLPAARAEITSTPPLPVPQPPQQQQP